MKFNKSMGVFLVVTMIFSSSCSQNPSSGGSVVAGTRKEFQARKTYTQGIVGGSLLGAGLGLLAGGLLGDDGWDPDGALAGAGIGAVSGGVAGGIFANEKVKQRQEYANAEKSLDSAIADAVSTRDAAIKFNEALESQLAVARSKRGALQGTLSDSRAVLAELDREIKTQKANIRVVTTTETTTTPISAASAARLQKEISSLEAQRSRLARNIKVLTPNSPGEVAPRA